MRDRGPGIAPADRAHVFDPFYTTKPDGNGLGLSIAHEIAHAHGATLTFTSEPGATEFVVAFSPVSDALVPALAPDVIASDGVVPDVRKVGT